MIVSGPAYRGLRTQHKNLTQKEPEALEGEVVLLGVLMEGHRHDREVHRNVLSVGGKRQVLLGRLAGGDE